MPRLFPVQIYHFRKLDGRDKCSKERIRYGREIYVLSCFDNLGFQIRIISLEESIGRSRRLLFGFPHDDDDDNDNDDDDDDTTSCKILARVQAFVIPRTLREAVPLHSARFHDAARDGLSLGYSHSRF